MATRLRKLSGDSMSDQYSSGINEGPIARARQRARELGEEGLALAKREAEQLIQDFGREPTGSERILLEHVAINTIGRLRLRSSRREPDFAD
jgi:hypothetical protein